VVADARAVEAKRPAPKVNADLEVNFRGSWSGYERDKFFYNPDGPHPRFFDAGYVMGLDFDDDGRAAIPVDIDGDGDLDLVLNSLQRLSVLENLSAPRHFARVRLSATRSQSLAIGATVRLRAGGVVQQDYVKVTDGFLTQVLPEMHFGLADATKVDSIEVRWPGGAVEAWKDLPVDSLIRLTEGNPVAATSTIPRWPEESRPRQQPAFSFEKQVDSLTDAGPRPVALAGKPAVINFWGPDCAPCKQELPRLQQLFEKFSAEAQFAGITVDLQDPAASRAVVEAFGLKYPQFVASEALLKSFYGPEGRAAIPATFVFDGSGRLRRTFLRAIEAAELAALLESFRDEGVFASDLELKGQQFLVARKFEEAIACLSKANGIQGGCSSCLSKIGMAWLGLANDAKGEEALAEAVRLDPSNAHAQVNLGSVRFKRGRAEEAILCFEAALRVRGDDPSTLVNLGNAHATLRHAPQAMEAFDRALKADPGCVAALIGKGKTCLIQGDVRAARLALEAAVALDPEGKEARMLLSRLPQ
jgi:tetratricopeptide (TPR) repeat protein